MLSPRIAAGALLLAMLTAGQAQAQAQAQTQATPGAPPAAQAAAPLRRIVLLTRVADLAAAGAPAAGPDVDVSRLPTLRDAETLAALRASLGKPIGPETIGAVRAAVMDAYVRAGRPFVLVITPPQDVSNGVLQVVASEGRAGKVTVDGARWFSEASYRDKLHLQPGQPIDMTQLQADVDWINRNPYRVAVAVAQPGAAEGATDIVLRIDEKRPWAFNAGLDNTGTEATGLERISFGVDWANAFGRGDGLNYHYSGSTDFEAVRSHALNYTTDLPWRHTLSLSASYAVAETEDGPDIGSTGESRFGAVRYSIPLPRRGAMTHGLGLGFDYKAADNDILFGGESVFPTTTEVDQFSLEYQAGRYDRLGATTLSLTGIFSPGGLSDRNEDAEFDAQRLGAKARYAYVRALVARRTSLPAKLSWTTRLVGQVADGPLLPSEQLALTGAQMVRGFVEGSAIRDQGVAWRNDLMLAPIALGPKLNLTPYWFLDAAGGQNRGDQPGVESWAATATTGPGLDLQIGEKASLLFSYGMTLYREGDVGPLLQAQIGLYGRF